MNKNAIPATSQEAVAGLASTTCPACNSAKQRSQAFCWRCFLSLPQQKKYSLYHRMGDGFERSYADALQWLRGNPGSGEAA